MPPPKITAVLTMLALFLGVFGMSCHHDHDHPHGHEDDHDDDHHAGGGAHGGRLVDLGSTGHVEVVHDHDASTVTLYFTGPDAKASLAVDSPPEIKLVTPEGPKVIATTASPDVTDSSKFQATDSALAAEKIDGRISVIIGGTTFQPDL